MRIEELRRFGQVLAETGMTTPQLEFILRTRRIDPDARVGTYRLFGPATVKKIKAAREEIVGRRPAVAV